MWAAFVFLGVTPLCGHAFSEGLKAVTRVEDAVYYASHHDGNVLIRFDNFSTEIVAGSADGQPGDVDGTGTDALLHGPQGLAFDGNSSIYFVDTFNSKLKRFDVEERSVATVAALGNASAVDSNKQGSNGAPFPIAVDVECRLAFVSLKYGKAVVAVDLDAAENETKRVDAPPWALPFLNTTITTVDLGCGKLSKPHGVAIRANGRLLLADDDAGVKLADLRGGTCRSLPWTTNGSFAFRDAAWVDDSVALLMERKAAGTVYAVDVDADRSRAIFGGGEERDCWKDGAGAVDGPGSGFWKAMSLSYRPGSLAVADTGGNFLRRLALDPADAFRDARATTVPCYLARHKFARCNAGTIEHYACGLGDGPYPQQLPPCAACMNASLGTWCACDAYRDAAWCAPRVAALTPRQRAYVASLN